MGRQRWGGRGGHDGCSGRESGEGRDGTVARKEEKQQSTTGCGNAGGIPTFTLAAAIIFTICKKNCDGLRDRVILCVDGGIRTRRDIAIAAMVDSAPSP